jgi:hypothetical protein
MNISACKANLISDFHLILFCLIILECAFPVLFIYFRNCPIGFYLNHYIHNLLFIKEWSQTIFKKYGKQKKSRISSGLLSLKINNPGFVKSCKSGIIIMLVEFGFKSYIRSVNSGNSCNSTCTAWSYSTTKMNIDRRSSSILRHCSQSVCNNTYRDSSNTCN